MVEKYEDKPQTQNHIAAVLYQMLDEARYRGLVAINNAEKMRIGGKPKRDAVWSAENCEAFLETAGEHRHGESVILYFHLLRFTCQRPGDVLRMRWSEFDGSMIHLRQEKTGKLLEVSCHADLRAILAEAKQSAESVFIVARAGGKKWPASYMREVFNEVRAKAKLNHLQARDLRRTGMVKLAEAGCTDFEVSAISGHSIDATRKILETYVPRTGAMAESAILKWERNEAKKSNALDSKGS